MITKTILAAAVALSFATVPALAQATSDKEQGGHHYSGGPKTESHHMGKKETTGTSKKKSAGSHHYSGGPRAEPHHMGEKKE